MAYNRQPAPISVEAQEDKWAEKYGEVINQLGAAKIFNRSTRTIRRYIDQGYLQTSPTGDILVRPAARWAYSNVKAVKKAVRI